MKRTGFVGQVSVLATREMIGRATAPAAKRSNFRRLRPPSTLSRNSEVRVSSKDYVQPELLLHSGSVVFVALCAQGDYFLVCLTRSPVD